MKNGVKGLQDCEMHLIPRCNSFVPNKETQDVKDDYMEDIYQSKPNNEAMKRKEGCDQFKDFIH